MADTTIDLLKNSSYVGKMDELIAAVKLGSGATSDVEWDNVKNKPTTIGGYGITDAKIENGTIILGNQTITPLTSAPVTSVNSKTGAVTLSAADVSAIPSTLTGTAGQVLTKTADGQEWKDVDIPTALPNPNALTFTGAVTGSYDGSAPLSVEIPSGGSGGGGIPSFEKIGTIDMSTMAAMNLAVEFTVTDVTEIVLIWTGMTNTMTSNSSLLLAFNSGDYYNTLGPRTGKAGTPQNGYTYLRVLENVGILPIVSAGAISNTIYTQGGSPCCYNLIPVKEKIQTFEIKQPSTQYYADAGIVEVYVR